MVRQMAMAGVLMGLVGCSSAPQPPQDAPSNWYMAVAASELWTEECTKAGFMSAESGGKSKVIVAAQKGGVTYYPYKLQELKEKLRGTVSPTQQLCLEVTQNIEAAYLARTEQLQKRSVVQPQRSNPSYTNCSTHFGQTHCYSY